MTFTYLFDYVRARTNKDRTVCESKRMIQAAFTGCKLKLSAKLLKRTTDQSNVIGPILALDLGEKLVGAAISDERLVTTKRLPPLKRSNWKRLLQDVRHLVDRFDAQTIVVGLPLRLDGTDGDAARNARRIATNLAKSIELPVYLQDERLTSFEAMENLKAEGLGPDEIPALVDGEAAATILRDFLDTRQERIRVDPD